MENNERRLNAIVYIITLCQTSSRFSQGLPAFDFESVQTAEFILSRCMPFIKNGDEDFEVAHKSFLLDMFQNGWSYGAENFSLRTHPDLVRWAQLSIKSREMVAFTAALVASVQDFYIALVSEMEEQLVNDLRSIIVKGKTFTGLKDTNTTH
jgi:hypothetical protein